MQHSDKYSFFASLCTALRADDIRLVLVGGSAFEWLPGLHASDDLDIVLLSF
jgi:hypothetical protein